VKQAIDESRPDLSKYGGGFYSDGGDLAYRAATIILSEIEEIYSFTSMVDFGCGAGGWLRAAKDVIGCNGRTPTLLGVDGPHAKAFASCEGAEFRFEDMENRIQLSRRFDLAISMEVAEHLTKARAEGFVEDIVATSDVVLFSAAVPGQGGTNHINEQWQSYWVEKFSLFGFRCFDVLRAKFWNHELLSLCPFYISNAFLYIRETSALVSKLTADGIPSIGPGNFPADIVHPGIFKGAHYESVGPKALATQLPRALLRAVRRRVSL